MALAHVLVVGQTLSGKTTLAKLLVADWLKQGIPCIVFDPRLTAWGEPGDERVLVVRDVAAFLAAVEGSVSCGVVWDESGGHFDRTDQQHLWVALESRHLGHRAVLITTYYKLLPPAVREQITTLYLFKAGVRTCKQVAEEWASPALELANKLPVGTCYKVTAPGGPELTVRLHLFTPREDGT